MGLILSLVGHPTLCVLFLITIHCIRPHMPTFITPNNTIHVSTSPLALFLQWQRTENSKIFSIPTSCLIYHQINWNSYANSSIRFQSLLAIQGYKFPFFRLKYFLNKQKQNSKNKSSKNLKFLLLHFSLKNNKTRIFPYER